MQTESGAPELLQYEAGFFKIIMFFWRGEIPQGLITAADSGKDEWDSSLLDAGGHMLHHWHKGISRLVVGYPPWGFFISSLRLHLLTCKSNYFQQAEIVK